MGGTTSKWELTMPDARALNLLQAGCFLKELREDESLPNRVRNEADRLLRHYPAIDEFRLLAKIEASFVGSNLLTLNFSASWLVGYRFGPNDR
jgi:hypothetical protein